MKAGNTLYPFGVKESLSVKGKFVATVWLQTQDCAS